MKTLAHQLLESSISNDETRFHLQCIFADDKKLIATDGHRMTVMNADHINVEQGKAFDGAAFSKAGVFAETKDVKYPNWKQFNPDLSQYRASYAVEIPLQFSQFKSKKSNENQVFCYLETDKLTTSMSRIDCMSEKPCFSVNAAYLRLFAGQSVLIYFKDSLSPIVIKDKSESFTYVVMPTRF